MRVGINPNRERYLKDMLPPELPVAAVIVHLPNAQDYHAERAEIVKAAVMSAKRNAGTEAHFVIWDNGSHYEMRRWLSDLAPDRLILSKNIGKMNAIKALCEMYHGAVIAISDDDILHYEGWLAKQLEVLDVFGADVVSGCVTRHYMKYTHLNGYKSFEYLEKYGVEKAEMIDTPLDWDLQHGASIGMDARISTALKRIVYPRLLHKEGVSALVGGNHCQFVAWTDALLNYYEHTERYMQPLYPIDVKMDDDGFLRLMTSERLTRHLGNVLSDKDRKEIEGML